MMKVNKRFVALGGVIVCLSMILSNVMAATTQTVPNVNELRKSWIMKTQDIRPGGKPQPKKILKGHVQKQLDPNAPVERDNTERKQRELKVDSLN